MFCTIDQKQLENVKCFKYLGSMLTDDGRCTCEIKSRIVMAKAAFNKKKNFFYQQIGLKFEEETSETLRLEHGSVWCSNLDAPGNRSETPGKF